MQPTARLVNVVMALSKYKLQKAREAIEFLSSLHYVPGPSASEQLQSGGTESTSSVPPQSSRVEKGMYIILLHYTYYLFNLFNLKGSITASTRARVAHAVKH